jgi:phosphoglycerate dehydrogenase-like enzyme
VLALPHLGYVTAANYRTYFTEAVQDIDAWLGGEPLRVITEGHPGGFGAQPATAVPLTP